MQLHQMKAKQEHDKELFNLDTQLFKGPMKIKPSHFSDQLQGYLLRECESSSGSGALAEQYQTQLKLLESFDEAQIAAMVHQGFPKETL